MRGPAGNSEVYDPWEDSWTPTTVLRHYVCGGGSAVLLPQGAVLFAGGMNLSYLAPDPLDEIPVSAAQLFEEGSP